MHDKQIKHDQELQTWIVQPFKEYLKKLLNILGEMLSQRRRQFFYICLVDVVRSKQSATLA